MKKVFRIIITTVIVLVVVIAVYLCTSDYLYKHYRGIQNISVSERASGKITVKVTYSDARGYSCRVMEENEKHYKGDYLVDYDNSLGKYRVELKFYDVLASKKFLKKYPAWEVHDITAGKTPLKMKGVYTPGHGFIIYLGSDTPLQIEQKDFTDIYLPTGIITFKINEQ